MCPVKLLLVSGWAGHAYASWTVFEMAARVLYYLSLILPTLSDAPVQPNHSFHVLYRISMN